MKMEGNHLSSLAKANLKQKRSNLSENRKSKCYRVTSPDMMAADTLHSFNDFPNENDNVLHECPSYENILQPTTTKLKHS